MLNTVVSGLSANSGSLGFVLGTGGKEGVKASFWSVHSGNIEVGVDLLLPQPVVPLLAPLSTIYLSLLYNTEY